MTLKEVHDERRVIHKEKPFFHPNLVGCVYIVVDTAILFFQGNIQNTPEEIERVVARGDSSLGYAILATDFLGRDIWVDTTTSAVGVYSSNIEDAVDLRNSNNPNLTNNA